MKSNKLIKYKENIFVKIHNFIKKIFGKKKALGEDETHELKNISNNTNNTFYENIQIKEDIEERRIKNLQQLYDNGEIDEDDLSEEDIDKLVALYENETEELNNDTLQRKFHIEQMLKELKNS